MILPSNLPCFWRPMFFAGSLIVPTFGHEQIAVAETRCAGALTMPSLPAPKEPRKPLAAERTETRPPRVARTARREKTAMRRPPCERESVSIERFATHEKDHFALTRCDGTPAEHALNRLSVLLRPANAPRPNPLPTMMQTTQRGLLDEGTGKDAVRGVKQVDAGLLLRVQAIAARFRGHSVVIVSGYRPSSEGSYHQEAKAVDVRVDGVKNEELVAFCRTLPDTGCGYYPNSTFAHVDARPAGSGHVHWIDASAPGETPRYVTAWPPPRGEDGRELPYHEGIVPHDASTDGEN